MKGKVKKSVSTDIISIKKYELKMFPLLSGSETLPIKKSMTFFFSTHCLFEAYSNCIWKDHTHISDFL